MGKNLSLGSKLVVNLVIPILGMFVISLFGYLYLSNIAHQTIHIIYEEAYKSISLTLNADRDLYQALTALQKIIYARNTDSKVIEDYSSNLSQVIDRISTMNQTLGKNKELWSTIKDDSGRNIFDLFSQFQTDITKWKNTSDSFINKVKDQSIIFSSDIEKWEGEFSQAREELNVIGELIDKGAEELANRQLKLARSYTFNLIIISILIGIITGLLGIFLLRSIRNPINRILETVNEISKGNLSVKEIEIKTRDELGTLAQEINTMLRNLKSIVSNLINTSTTISGTGQDIVRSIEEISKAIQQVSSTIQGVAGGAQETAKSVTDASTAVEKMSEKMDSLAQETSNIERSTKETLNLTEKGQNVVNELNIGFTLVNEATNSVSTVMAELETAAGEIGRIVETITSISSQTNLLALNAAIEAARAGEAGRGFAVVADEVRKLAEESNQSAQRIAQFIEEIRSRITKAAESTNEAVRVISSQVEIGGNVTETFNRIADANRSIMEMINSIASSVSSLVEDGKRISESVQSIAAIAEENAASSEEVSAATEEITAEIGEMESSVRRLSDLALELDRVRQQFIM